MLLTNLHLYGEWMSLNAANLCVDFQLVGDQKYEVEIYDSQDGFYAIASLLTLNVAQKILEMTFNNESFGECVFLEPMNLGGQPPYENEMCALKTMQMFYGVEKKY